MSHVLGKAKTLQSSSPFGSFWIVHCPTQKNYLWYIALRALGHSALQALSLIKTEFWHRLVLSALLACPDTPAMCEKLSGRYRSYFILFHFCCMCFLKRPSLGELKAWKGVRKRPCTDISESQWEGHGGGDAVKYMKTSHWDAMETLILDDA